MFAISQRATETLGLAKPRAASGVSPSQAKPVDAGNQALFEQSFDAIVTINSRFEIVAANSSAQLVFGGAVTVVPVPVDRFIRCAGDHTMGEPRGVSEMLRQEDTWTNQTIPAIAVRADGRHVPMQLRVVGTNRGGASGLILILGTAPDSNQADTTYYNQFESSRDFLENMPDGVFQCRRDGTILAANSAMAQLLGYSSREDLQQNANIRDVCLFPDQRDALLECLSKHGEVRDAVIDVYRKDLVERTTRVDIVQIPGGPGQEIILQGTFRDVTEEQSGEHIRALADNGLDLLTIIDDNAQFIYSSPSSASLLGYAPDEMRGKSAFDLVHPDDIDALSYFIVETFREPGTRNSLTFRCRHSNGKTVHMESLGTAFVGRNGAVRGVINLRDISRRLRREHQLEQTQKLEALGQLAGGIAHNFNNQLTAIVGCLQLINESGSPGEIEEQVAIAVRAVMRGSALTKQLLGFAHKQPLQPVNVNVGALVAGMEPTLREILGSSVNLNINCDDDLWPVHADPSQLEDSIVNLATNARDAMGEQGNLSIDITNVDAMPTEFGAKFSDPVRECVCISIADDGSGMSEVIRRRATEPFFTTKANRGSSGLGLSVVYGFIRQSEGYFRMRNRDRKGVRADMLLPRASKTLDTDSQGDKSPSLPRGDETVLVVDDDADIRESSLRLISQLGYNVLCAEDGDAALEVMRSIHVDLLFTDVHMPGMTGFELANEARTRFPEAGIILTSGFAGGAALPAGLDLTDSQLLPKPYNKEDLAKRIRAVLDDSQ